MKRDDRVQNFFMFCFVFNLLQIHVYLLDEHRFRFQYHVRIPRMLQFPRKRMCERKQHRATFTIVCSSFYELNSLILFQKSDSKPLLSPHHAVVSNPAAKAWL